MRILFILISVLLYSVGILGQISNIKVEKIIINSEEKFNAPKFSPDGKTLFFTNMNYDGIWSYNLETKEFQEITKDPKSGFEFCILADAQKIAYRRTYYKDNGEREQEIILKDLNTNDKKIIAKSHTLSTPTFVNGNIVFTEGNSTKNLVKLQSDNNISVLGIEDTKIALNLYGEKILYDPYNGGSYIWPYLSNDKKRIVAYEADRGTFIADLNGNILRRLGRLDGANWSYDDKYLVFMNDKDDGHKILSSDIVLISAESNDEYYVTNTPDIIELNPVCSPVENKIVFNSDKGEIFIATYEESK